MYHKYLSFDLLNFSLIHKSHILREVHIFRRITIIYLYVWEFILCSLCLKVYILKSVESIPVIHIHVLLINNLLKKMEISLVGLIIRNLGAFHAHDLEGD